MTLDQADSTRRRVKLLTGLFIVGLVLSGATAIPLQRELEASARILGVPDGSSQLATTALSKWILTVRDALRETNAQYPFVASPLDKGTGRIVQTVAEGVGMR